MSSQMIDVFRYFSLWYSLLVKLMHFRTVQIMEEA